MTIDVRYLAATWPGLPMNRKDLMQRVSYATPLRLSRGSTYAMELAADHEALHLVGALDDL